MIAFVVGVLAVANPCTDPAPPALAAAFAEGIALPWRQADRLLPQLHLERALVRQVVVRAEQVGVCAGRVIAADPRFELQGVRQTPVEAVLATVLRPTPVFGVTEADVQVSPPAGTIRVSGRYTFTAFGGWDLGAAR